MAEPSQFLDDKSREVLLRVKPGHRSGDLVIADRLSEPRGHSSGEIGTEPDDGPLCPQVERSSDSSPDPLPRAAPRVYDSDPLATLDPLCAPIVEDLTVWLCCGANGVATTRQRCIVGSFTARGSLA